MDSPMLFHHRWCYDKMTFNSIEWIPKNCRRPVRGSSLSLSIPLNGFHRHTSPGSWSFRCPFNSIEWIRGVLGNCGWRCFPNLSIPLNGFLKVLQDVPVDSLIYVLSIPLNGFYYLPILDWSEDQVNLSIPLNGFIASPASAI